MDKCLLNVMHCLLPDREALVIIIGSFRIHYNLTTKGRHMGVCTKSIKGTASNPSRTYAEYPDR